MTKRTTIDRFFLGIVIAGATVLLIVLLMVLMR
jgi:hypothetical protein